MIKTEGIIFMAFNYNNHTGRLPDTFQISMYRF